MGSLLYKPPDFSGRRVGARTPDLCRVEATLYQLSYAPISTLKKIRTARRRNLTLGRHWGANGKGANVCWFVFRLGFVFSEIPVAMRDMGREIG